MKPSIQAKLSQLADRLEEVSALLASEEATRDMDQYRKLNREYSEITPVVELWHEFNRINANLADAESMLSDPEMGPILKWPIWLKKKSKTAKCD